MKIKKSNINELLNEMELYGSLRINGAWLLDHPHTPGLFQVHVFTNKVKYSYAGRSDDSFESFKENQLYFHSLREERYVSRQASHNISTDNRTVEDVQGARSVKHDRDRTADQPKQH